MANDSGTVDRSSHIKTFLIVQVLTFSFQVILQVRHNLNNINLLTQFIVAPSPTTPPPDSLILYLAYTLIEIYVRVTDHYVN